MRIPILTAAILAAPALLLAEPIEYDYTYEAEVLPDSDDANPLWLRHSERLQPADGAEMVEEGGDKLLSASTVSVPESVLSWRVGTNTAGGDGFWNGGNPEGSTVDLRFKVEEELGKGTESFGLRPGFSVSVSDGRKWVALFFGVKGLTLKGAGIVNIPDVDHSQFRDYRIAFQEGSLTLYVAGDSEPVVQGFEGAELARNSLMFGDGSGFVGGRYTLKYIRWTNRKAVFAAPDASPEP